jgi:hypothetical protein
MNNAKLVSKTAMETTKLLAPDNVGLGVVGDKTAAYVTLKLVADLLSCTPEFGVTASIPNDTCFPLITTCLKLFARRTLLNNDEMSLLTEPILFTVTIFVPRMFLFAS